MSDHPSVPPSSGPGERRLAAVVFTDVVGYSSRMQADEAGTLALVRSDFEAMRRLCAQHGGQTLKSTGDGLLLCFNSVVDAASCALAIQAGFAGRGDGTLQHRIGIHLGDVYHQAGDITGDGVNLAARLQTAAQPGTICVSESVFAAIKGKVAMESAALAPLVLKNIAQPKAAHLIAPVGTRLAAGPRARGFRRRRGWTLAAIGVASLAAAAAFFFHRAENSAAEFPRDPDLKRAHQLIYAFDSIAEDFALADSLVQPRLKERPNDPEVVTVAAEVAQEFTTRGFDQTQSRRAEAQRLTEHAVQLAPENPEALGALGAYLYSTKEQLGRAEKLLRDAIRLNPQEARYYRTLYGVLGLARRIDDADALGRSMVERFPRDPLVAYVIALRYLRADAPDFAVAEQWLDRTLALELVPNAITWKARFRLEVHGDIEGMKQCLERMPDRQRTSARMVYTYTELAFVSGDTAPARRLLGAVTDIWLADGTYIFPRAMLLGDLEQLDGHDDVARIQYEAALADVKNMKKADPTDLRLSRPELWVQLGLRHHDEALTALRVNLQLRPKPFRWDLNKNWWSSAPRAGLLLGERADALALLKEACAEPPGRLLLRNLFRVDPMMAPWRADPEIAALLNEPEAKPKP